MVDKSLFAPTWSWNKHWWQWRWFVSKSATCREMQ